MNRPLSYFDKTLIYEECVACMKAVLDAIASGELLSALPGDTSRIDDHNTGSWLLALARDKITMTEQKLDGGKNVE